MRTCTHGSIDSERKEEEAEAELSNAKAAGLGEVIRYSGVGARVGLDMRQMGTAAPMSPLSW